MDSNESKPGPSRTELTQSGILNSFRLSIIPQQIMPYYKAPLLTTTEKQHTGKTTIITNNPVKRNW